MLLLDHRGRRSGRMRTTPLIYIEDGQNLVIVASRGGSDAPPAWSLNLQATPQCSVQVGTERRAVTSRTATPAERETLWPRVVAVYAGYETYSKRTEREIPLIVLEPRD